MNEYGIVLVSHVSTIPIGVKRLIEQVAPHVSITTSGGTEKDEVGTSIEKIQAAIEENEGQKLLAFYDLGSAKMNLEVCQDLTEKQLIIYDVPLIEGSYTAAALIEVGQPLEEINEQLQGMKIK